MIVYRSTARYRDGRHSPAGTYPPNKVSTEQSDIVAWELKLEADERGLEAAAILHNDLNERDSRTYGVLFKRDTIQIETEGS